MFTLITFFGIVLTIFTIAMLIIRPSLKKERVELGTDRMGRMKYSEKSHPALLWFTPSKSVVLLIVGLIFSLSSGLFMYGERGYQYLLVYPNGQVGAVTEPGIKLKWFARVDPWQKYIDVKVVEDAQKAELDEIEGVMNPISLRFIDQVTAKGVVSIRFQIPSDVKSFVDMAIEFRSMDNLVQNTLIPTVSEQLKQTTYMFAAQDYVSGSAQAFRQTFEETLLGGTYVVKKTVNRDTIFGDIQQNGSRQIKDIQTSYLVEKVVDSNGLPKRIPHDITKNNIKVSQVIVDDIDTETKFKERLEAQRDESAKRQLEQQKIKTAKDAQLRIVAEGERDKAAERVEQEKTQVKTLIAIETKKKEEATKRELAEIELKTAKLQALTIKELADAEAYKNKKLVTAGLTPQEKAYWAYRSDSVNAAYISKMATPTIMSGSGNGDGNGEVGTLLQMQILNQLKTKNGGN